MTSIRIQIGALALVLAGAMLSTPTTARAEGEGGCTAAKCHASLTKPENQHQVLENCEGCHSSNGEPHPSKGKKGFELVNDMPDLCFTCHEELGKKKVVHFPVANTPCTTCHNPHSSAQEKLLNQPMKELCTSCHPDVLDAKEPHGPVSAGSCTACHEQHESDHEKLLHKDEQELCLECHKDMKGDLEKSHVHPVVTAGCTSCHKPHGGSQRKLLDSEVSELCFTCHPDVQEAVQSAKVSHPALKERSCVNCHSPHASDNPGMLLLPQLETCLSCHKSIPSKGAKFLHGEEHSGKCTDCHGPHGSEFPKLLVEEFPSTAYVPYTDSEFALCFKCHKREMVEYAETSYATGFRDGDRNLHYVHVNNKTKARSCLLCHSQHGGNNPKLIAETVRFGQWDLPIKYVKTETGGGCTPGCHKPLAYDRKQPGRKPPAMQEPKK